MIVATLGLTVASSAMRMVLSAAICEQWSNAMVQKNVRWDSLFGWEWEQTMSRTLTRIGAAIVTTHLMDSKKPVSIVPSRLWPMKRFQKV
jgi:hypothetical protein